MKHVAVVIGTLLVLFAGALTGSGQVLGAESIQPAPAFTPEQLSEHNPDGWLTNGGTLNNQRYSPLAQINRDNVANLKAVWHTRLNSALELRHNNQAQPLVHEGVIYNITGQNDVFALSVETGEILWENRSGLVDNDAFVCCMWASRGVGLGGGKVFVGRLDATLVALDQQTGKLLWENRTGEPTLGYSLTAAPLYYDGMVIIGSAGGDLGIQGWLRAFDAGTGEEIWRFNVVPSPGEFGHDTWPQDRDAWKYGGGSVWTTPAVDAELGMLYFSTGNPGPSLGGAGRPGDNLFTASIVALDVYTGKYRWHFQEVHHDIWDYDAPNPVILFDAEYDGVIRHGLAQAGKTGFVYILDRVTGEPLVGIEERPVMQEAKQATSPTQPFPIGDSLVPLDVAVAPEDYDLVNAGRIFTPFTEEPRIFTPLAAVNWPPSAYDPATNWMYICANENVNGARFDATMFEAPTFKGSYRGGAYVGPGLPSTGIYSAIDLKTNRLAWQRRFVDGCRSGSLVTAGGLVFVGRNDGRLTALDSSNGHRLWEFQTEAPVNTSISTFMHEGKQYLVTYAGGGWLDAVKGDGIWVFSLEGTLDEFDPASQADAATLARMPSADRVANISNGESVYKAACTYCHGDNGEGGEGGGKAIAVDLGIEGIFNVLNNGRNQMPAFGVSMNSEQMHDVASYVLHLRETQ